LEYRLQWHFNNTGDFGVCTSDSSSDSMVRRYDEVSTNAVLTVSSTGDTSVCVSYTLFQDVNDKSPKTHYNCYLPGGNDLTFYRNLAAPSTMLSASASSTSNPSLFANPSSSAIAPTTKSIDSSTYLTGSVDDPIMTKSSSTSLSLPQTTTPSRGNDFFFWE
jgi:hypothetical protein